MRKREAEVSGQNSAIRPAGIRMVAAWCHTHDRVMQRVYRVLTSTRIKLYRY